MGSSYCLSCLCFVFLRVGLKEDHVSGNSTQVATGRLRVRGDFPGPDVCRVEPCKTGTDIKSDTRVDKWLKKRRGRSRTFRCRRSHKRNSKREWTKSRYGRTEDGINGSRRWSFQRDWTEKTTETCTRWKSGSRGGSGGRSPRSGRTRSGGEKIPRSNYRRVEWFPGCGCRYWTITSVVGSTVDKPSVSKGEWSRDF